MRRLRLIRALSVCVVLCAMLAVSAAAAAASPQGVLTRAEYRQLHAAKSRIRSLTEADARSFRRAAAICAHIRTVSPLIASVRTGCEDLLALGRDHDRLNAAATRCGINPGTEAAIFTCLVPTVRRYASDAQAFYVAEARTNRIATARGFSSRCVAVLGDSQRNVSAEGRLAGDLRTIVRALQKQNTDALQSLTGRIDRDINAIHPGPSSLSLCPHR